MVAEQKPHILMLASSRSVHTMRWAVGLRARGWSVTLMTRDPEEPYRYHLHDIPVVRLPGTRKRVYIAGTGFVKDFVKRNGISFIHAFYASEYGLLATLSRCAPVLLSVMGTDVFSYPDKTLFHKWMIRFVLLRAHKVASTSRVMAARVSELTKKKVSPVITPFGVDINHFKPADEKKQKSGKLHIISVRHLHYKYGLDLLIKAIELAMTRLSIEITLDVFGDGPERNRLGEQIKTAGLEGKISLCGYLNPENLPQKLQQADLFVAPSREESFGVAILEASACGIPVIGSDAGGIPEVIEDGVTGLLFPTGSAEKLSEHIITLTNSPQLRERLATAGRERTEKMFSECVCLDQMEKVYRMMLSETK